MQVKNRDAVIIYIPNDFRIIEKYILTPKNVRVIISK